MRIAGLLVAVAAVIAVAAYFGTKGDGGEEESAQSPATAAEDFGLPIEYAQIQAIFDEYGCISCHPGVNPSLDLTAAKSYDQLVGVRALEDPTLYRVVAGDPERSFLYLKVGGAAPVADIPAIGTRMPPRAPPIDQADMDLIHNWILQGAKNEDGVTGGPAVPTPGSPPRDLDIAAATEIEGTGTVTGSVVDQRFEPIEGALVTMLLSGPDQEGGQEHYRVAVTDAEGRYTLEKAPVGQFLLKAYAPDTIYVSRIVAVKEGESQAANFGLPYRRVPNPSISKPKVEVVEGVGTDLSIRVEGSDLSGNYTLAVNPGAGLVFELHSPGRAPGLWRAEVAQILESPWIFVAVDENCNISEFLTAEG